MSFGFREHRPPLFLGDGIEFRFLAKKRGSTPHRERFSVHRGRSNPPGGRFRARSKGINLVGETINRCADGGLAMRATPDRFPDGVKPSCQNDRSLFRRGRTDLRSAAAFRDWGRTPPPKRSSVLQLGANPRGERSSVASVPLL